jgi:POT family proton-dependent oligopeptide transporter
MNAFYAGLAFVTFGVGALKPNISSMVGDLYATNDPRRDQAFSYFYMGINLGALIAAFIVGYVGQTINWHYGFALAGIGMVFGQITFFCGKKYFHPSSSQINVSSTSHAKPPLSAIEKDRMKVLAIAAIPILAFWAAFEQSGGLLTIYIDRKIDRIIAGWEVPASMFTSVNAIFILMLGAIIAHIGKPFSSLARISLGMIIMSCGFFAMGGAAWETTFTFNGKASLLWLISAYFLHTIGELFLMPVALCLVTRLAPQRYSSLMMGFFWAAIGLSLKLAGLIGESSKVWGEQATFFGIATSCFTLGLLLMLVVKPLNKMTHGAEL